VRLTFRLSLPCGAADAFAWHERPGAFERLAPPWRPVRVLERTGGIRDGARVTLDLGVPAGRWRLVHEGYEGGRRFRDRQLAGPFAHYLHTHRFVPSPEGDRLEDELEWSLPGGPLGALADGFVRREFARLFAWRHAVTREDLARAFGAPGPALTVGLTGASGFLGRALTAYLTTQGHQVVRFVRGRAAHAGEVAWDPARGELRPEDLAGLDAVVHLSGAGIAERPWTPERRRELVESRVASTELLARVLAAKPGRTRVLVSASAVGWYGDRGDETLDETSAPGSGFLADLARAWEAAAAPAARGGVRVVHPRIGIVLWPTAGALEPLALPFRLGGGGPLGSGRAWWSWVGLHDLLDMILFAVRHEGLVGPFNAVAPEPVRQGELARTLGRSLGRPSWLPAPVPALRAVMGRARADELLLASQRVRPVALERAGYRHRDPELGALLDGLYGRPLAEAVA